MHWSKRRAITGVLTTLAALLLIGAQGPPSAPPQESSLLRQTTPVRPVALVEAPVKRTSDDDESLPPLPPALIQNASPSISSGRGISAAPLGAPLIPEQTIHPIDLPSALRLAGARDLDIAI